MNNDIKGPRGQGFNRDDKSLDLDVPDQSDRVSADNVTDENEGEGSRTAARRYNDATERYIRSGKVEEKALDAVDAVDGDEGPELREAEERGKQGPRVSRR